MFQSNIERDAKKKVTKPTTRLTRTALGDIGNVTKNTV